MCKQKPIELKEEINRSTLIAGDVNSSLWVIDRNTRKSAGCRRTEPYGQQV